MARRLKTPRVQATDTRIARDFLSACVSHNLNSACDAFEGVEYIDEFPSFNDVLPCAGHYTKLVQAGQFGERAQSVLFGMFFDSFFGKESGCVAAMAIWEALYPIYSDPAMHANSANPPFERFDGYVSASWQCGVFPHDGGNFGWRFASYASTMYPCGGSAWLANFDLRYLHVTGARLLRPQYALHPAVVAMQGVAKRRWMRKTAAQAAAQVLRELFDGEYSTRSVFDLVPGLADLLRALRVSDYQIIAAMEPKRGAHPLTMQAIKMRMPSFVHEWGEHSTVLLRAAQAAQNRSDVDGTAEYTGSAAQHMNRNFRSAVDMCDYNA